MTAMLIPAASSRAAPSGAGGGPPRLWAWSHFQSHLLQYTAVEYRPGQAAEHGKRLDWLRRDGQKYRLIVLIGLLLILADLGVIGGLVFAVVVSARRLRPSQLARPGASASGRWATLIAAVTLLGLVVLGNVRFLISAYEDGRPSLAQVAGTWTDSAAGGTATLRVFPDGTFTATGLPPDTDSSTGHDVTVQALPADEHGTWQMTRGDGEWYVLFLLSGGPQVRFDIVPPIQPGHLLGANFTYIQGQFSLPTVWGFDRTSLDPEYRAG